MYLSVEQTTNTDWPRSDKNDQCMSACSSWLGTLEIRLASTWIAENVAPAHTVNFSLTAYMNQQLAPSMSPSVLSYLLCDGVVANYFSVKYRFRSFHICVCIGDANRHPTVLLEMLSSFCLVSFFLILIAPSICSLLLSGNRRDRLENFNSAQNGVSSRSTTFFR